MAIQIIEQSIISKYPEQDQCEDGLFIGNDYIAVADGVTGKGTLRWPPAEDRISSITPLSMTSGRYAREVLLKALKTMPPDMDGPSAIGYLNQALARAGQGRAHILREHREERLQAVIILYSRRRREVWSFGDCQCIIGHELYTHSKKIDDLMAQVRSLYDQTELMLGRTVEELCADDPGRSYILPLLRRQLMFANQDSPWGYDVLDGFAIHPEHVAVHPVQPGAQVVLASDGYPKLQESLAESEDILHALIEKDPLCIWENPGTKGLVKGNVSFDDRTYVRFIG